MSLLNVIVNEVLKMRLHIQLFAHWNCGARPLRPLRGVLSETISVLCNLLLQYFEPLATTQKKLRTN